MEQLTQDLRGWNDSVGERVSALAVPAMRGFSDYSERLKKSIKALEEAVKKKPETGVHTIPSLDPPEETEEAPQDDTLFIQSGLPDCAGA